ncbi:MAG: NUDIX hydrolase [Caldilinea sp.]|nr:NUDIX hydrolase [Caldilinea sp.]MDW8439281.1 NUDIX hydrolase [Caldilineaceae bacterium]
MRLIDAIDTEELKSLQRRWGAFPVVQAVLDVADPFLSGEHQQLASNGRRAEICYILHRGDPMQGVLLHAKTFYPEGIYRLPTGGVHVGERILETVAREIFEETGLRVGDGDADAQVERCLGVLAYALHHARLGAVSFATYHFLVRMPPDAEIAPQDPEESIRGWEWRPAPELSLVADRLAMTHCVSRRWADWGRYRALSHRFVAEHLR